VYFDSSHYSPSLGGSLVLPLLNERFGRTHYTHLGGPGSWANASKAIDVPCAVII